MKKTLAIAALSIIGLGLVSCKKESTTTENNEMMVADTNTVNMPDSIAAMSSGTDAVSSAAKSNLPLTTVALAQSNYDFGNIKKGEKVSHVYEITNTGKNPLIISEVKPGCGCTAPEFTKEPIMPGQKGKITLSFDSASFDGTVSKYADVFANVEKAPIKLNFIANIQP